MSPIEQMEITIKNAGLQFFGEEVPDEDITVLDMAEIGSIFVRKSTKQSFLFVTHPKMVEGELQVRSCVIRL